MEFVGQSLQLLAVVIALISINSNLSRIARAMEKQNGKS